MSYMKVSWKSRNMVMDYDIEPWKINYLVLLTDDIRKALPALLYWACLRTEGRRTMNKN